MSSQTETPQPAHSLRERRKEQTRTELVAGVLDVIDSLGFEKLTIERISRAAGVSRGTVYAHFPGGMTELVSAAYAHIGCVIVDTTTAHIEAADSWSDELIAHARAMFDFAANSRSGHFYNVSGPAFIATGEARGIGSGASLLMIADTLDRAQGQGRLRVQITPNALATLLVGAIREAATEVACGAADPAQEITAFAALVSGLEKVA
ncbi:TetR/AcrR family transcriptional regulator [Brevibacterium aurantiacum]|uniref:TetR/AcrR family transcriptional regulator n=1 Tax=Brevibacterium aurantiacum TaxID=273384 RepID=UPI001867C526|nr:TetR/AcrR family transcriptional regulator [Brevibacterium aurantiacum]